MSDTSITSHDCHVKNVVWGGYVLVLQRYTNRKKHQPSGCWATFSVVTRFAGKETLFCLLKESAKIQPGKAIVK
jgi:hypothetical protein